MKQRTPHGMKALIISFVVIGVCEVFFLWDVIADIFRLDVPTPWLDHSQIELIAAIFLALSLGIIGWQVVTLNREYRAARSTVKAASGQLLGVIYDRFELWQLSPSEAEIALLLIKGLSTQEICTLRETQPGTVKSQSSAIYRKAGVAGRQELAAYFVEDLLAGESLLVPADDETKSQ